MSDIGQDIRLYHQANPSGMKKVLFINKAHPVLRKRLEAMGYVCEEDLQCDLAALRQMIPAYEGLVLRSRLPVDARLLQAGTKLRFVAREGIGLEHIDVAAAEKLGIAVLNSPEGSRDAVGEHALGMLLSLLNKLCKADREVRAGQWLREENRGRELGELCVGILGYGNTGKAFACKLSGLFPKRVVAYDKYLRNYGDAYAEEVDLNEFFSVAEVLSIHIPGDASNRYFVDGLFLDSFAHPIYLLNTARGMVLNTKDLLQRLQNGRVLAAGLDVLEYESPALEMEEGLEHPVVRALRQMDNVLLTPHIAGWSFASKRKHAEVLAEKIAHLPKG